jgi:protein tyrosine phosphatase
MHFPVDPIQNEVSSSIKPQDRIYPFGKILFHSVSWLRAERDNPIQTLIKKILIVAAAILLSLSLVGTPLLVLAALEWNRQKNPKIEKSENPEPESPEITHIADLFPLKKPELNLPLFSEKLDVTAKNIEKLEELKPCTLLFQRLAKETAKLIENAKYLETKRDVVQRFKDIPCIAKTAIKIEGATQPYLHANRVELKKEDLPKVLQEGLKKESLSKSILTQAPIGKAEYIGAAANDTREQFWRAVLKKGGVIIDLTKPTDKGAKYCPEEEHQAWTDIGKMDFGKLTVKTLEIKEMKYDIKVYKCQIQDVLHGKAKTLFRIHFPDWTDHEGLDKIDLEKILYLYELEKKFCIAEDMFSFTHCLAGVGRSGTYTVAKALIELHKEGLLTKENAQEFIKALILSGRKQRGLAFVQSEKQLQTLLDLSDFLTRQGKEKQDTLTTEAKTVQFKTINESLDWLQGVAINGLNTAYDIEMLDQMIIDLKDLLIESKLTDQQKFALNKYLGQIKSGSSESWGQGYVSVFSTKYNNSLVLSETLKAKINWIMNVIQSNVPKSVKAHSAFHPEIIHSKNVFDLSKSILFKEFHFLKAQGKIPGAVYLYRDSSSRSGPENIQTFTLSIFWPNNCETEINNVRFAYNGKTKRWQLAHPVGYQNKKEPIYDLDSSSIITPKHLTGRLGNLQEWFSKGDLSFDPEGNLINSFPTLEALTLVMLSNLTGMPPSEFSPANQ